MGTSAASDDARAAPKWLQAASRLLALVPAGLGAHAAARKVIASSQTLRRLVLQQRLCDGAVFELDLSDPTQAQAYLIRRYEPGVVAALIRLIPRGGVFFDVGANIGLISFCVGIRRPDLTIIAFEPDPANVTRWHRNLELNNGVNAALEETAVGAERREAQLIRGDESGWSFIAPSGSEPGVTVPMVTLDAYVRAHGFTTVDGLKVDVEGYEPYVLKGATSLLEKQAIRCIVCELEDSLLERSGFTRNDVLSFLAGYGYVARPVPPVGAQRLRRRAPETSRDILFVPKSSGNERV
jgi:FkbM family methyltransferase